jgi:hypothetical protein
MMKAGLERRGFNFLEDQHDLYNAYKEGLPLARTDSLIHGTQDQIAFPQFGQVDTKRTPERYFPGTLGNHIVLLDQGNIQSGVFLHSINGEGAPAVIRTLDGLVMGHGPENIGVISSLEATIRSQIDIFHGRPLRYIDDTQFDEANETAKKRFRRHGYEDAVGEVRDSVIDILFRRLPAGEQLSEEVSMLVDRFAVAEVYRGIAQRELHYTPFEYAYLDMRAGVIFEENLARVALEVAGNHIANIANDQEIDVDVVSREVSKAQANLGIVTVAPHANIANSAINSLTLLSREIRLGLREVDERRIQPIVDNISADLDKPATIITPKK